MSVMEIFQQLTIASVWPTSQLLRSPFLDNFWIADQSSEWHSFDAGRCCAQSEELTYEIVLSSEFRKG